MAEAPELNIVQRTEEFIPLKLSDEHLIYIYNGKRISLKKMPNFA